MQSTALHSGRGALRYYRTSCTQYSSCCSRRLIVIAYTFQVAVVPYITRSVNHVGTVHLTIPDSYAYPFSIIHTSAYASMSLSTDVDLFSLHPRAAGSHGTYVLIPTG